MGGWWRWALVSPDGVAPSRMVGVFASVNLPLHDKVQKFSSGTGSPGWSQKRGRKTVVVVVVVPSYNHSRRVEYTMTDTKPKPASICCKPIDAYTTQPRYQFKVNEGSCAPDAVRCVALRCRAAPPVVLRVVSVC